jgi:hypothetical protein
LNRMICVPLIIALATTLVVASTTIAYGGPEHPDIAFHAKIGIGYKQFHDPLGPKRLDDSNQFGRALEHPCETAACIALGEP